MNTSQKKKKVAIIGTNGLPANYGGFETLVSNIHEKISDKNEVSIYCSNRTPKGDKFIGKTRLIRLPLSANGAQSFIYDFISIIHALFYADILLILGLGGGFALPLLRLFKPKIIYNPGGVETNKIRGLSFTRRLETYVKNRFNLGFFELADKIVLDNEAFMNSMVEYKKKTVLIEYGGEDKSKLVLTKSNKCPFKRYDVSVSRAQEDMNIHLVLEAYVNSPRNLILISNWHTSDYGRELLDRYKNKYENIYLHEAIYDKAELNTIRSNAEMYIHSHMLCGTAPSLVEAMSLNLPIICFDVDTNRFSTENMALYFQTAKQLKQLLEMIDDKMIDKLRFSMNEIAQRRYKWELIADKYEALI